MTEKGQQDLTYLQKRVNSAFKEVCPEPSISSQLDGIIDGREYSGEWNPVKMEPDQLDEYTSNLEDHFLNIQNWYKTITGKGDHGTRLWKQLVKVHLLDIQPDYASILDRIELKEDDAFKNYTRVDANLIPDYIPSYQNQNSIIVIVNFTKEVTEEKAQDIITDSDVKIELKERLAKDLKLFENQLKIKFQVREPKEKFLELSKRRMDNLERAFNMINRLSNKKYYNFEGREHELSRIKHEIFKLTEYTIKQFEGGRAARDFSRLVEENKREPF